MPEQTEFLTDCFKLISLEYDFMNVVFLKPPLIGSGKNNIVRDFVYGCWCNGKRIGGMQMPPLTELYCATHVKNSGFNVKILDALVQQDEWLEIEADGFSSCDIVIIMSSTQSFAHDCRVVEQMKEKNPKITAILFGSHPTFMPDACLGNLAIDYIVLREAEESLRQLCLAVLNKSQVSEVLGIAYRDESQKICYTQPRPFMDMDDLPIPDRSMLPENVDYFNPAIKRTPYTTMLTSRGCPGKCVFCTAPFFYGNKYRFRSAEKVMEELREIKRLGYKEVFIRDETFTANKKRNHEICKMMIDEKLDLTWIANARTDMIDKQGMQLMKKAGCHLLKFGVETGSDDMLKVYRKGTTTNHARQAFAWAGEIGLDTHAHMVIGGPRESVEIIKQSVEFVKDIGATTASFGILTPYPGTPLFEEVLEKYPDAIGDGSGSTMDNLHTKGFYSEAYCDIPPEELSRLIVWAYRSFYFRPLHLLKRFLSIRSFSELMILIVAGLNIFSFSFSGKK